MTRPCGQVTVRLSCSNEDLRYNKIQKTAGLNAYAGDGLIDIISYRSWSILVYACACLVVCTYI